MTTLVGTDKQARTWVYRENSDGLWVHPKTVETLFRELSPIEKEEYRNQAADYLAENLTPAPEDFQPTWHPCMQDYILRRIILNPTHTPGAWSKIKALFQGEE